MSRDGSAPSLQPGERDRRESLVHLVEIEVRDAPAGAFERDPGRADRLVEHDDGIARSDRQVIDARERRQIVRFKGALVGDQNARRPSQIWEALPAVITPSGTSVLRPPRPSNDAS